METLLTIDGAAAVLQLSPSRIKQLIASGEIRVAKLGKAVRIDPADLKDYVDRNKRPATVTDFVTDSSIQRQVGMVSSDLVSPINGRH